VIAGAMPAVNVEFEVSFITDEELSKDQRHAAPSHPLDR
jgi:hypothetical protein